MVVLLFFDIVIGIHALRVILLADERFMSYAIVKNFLHHTTQLVQPIKKTAWCTALAAHNVDVSSYIVLLAGVVLRSTLSQMIRYADLSIAHVPIVFIAMLIITVSSTCFVLGGVLIAEWLSGRFAFTQSATHFLHRLIMPLLYVIKIEPLISRTTGSRVSLLIAATGLLIAAFALRYASAWILLL